MVHNVDREKRFMAYNGGWEHMVYYLNQSCYLEPGMRALWLEIRANDLPGTPKTTEWQASVGQVGLGAYLVLTYLKRRPGKDEIGDVIIPLWKLGCGNNKQGQGKSVTRMNTMFLW